MEYIKPFSYDNYLTYKIEQEDTPERVATKLNIDLYKLRSYHNRYCRKEDCIGPVFPGHLKFLIIQSDEEILAKEAYCEPVRFSTQAFKLPFHPESLNKKYLAMYTIEKGNEKRIIKEELTVKWLSTYKDDYFFFEIDRKSLYIDEKETKSMADELAEITAKVFYPLQIVVDINGKFVAIHNFSSIVDRWSDVKKEVFENFSGDAAMARLEVFENNLEDKEIISKAFSGDWFLNAFFGGLNIEYKETGTIENTIKFTFLQKSGEMEFLVQQKILPTVDQYNLINITQNGFLSDTRTKDDFENTLTFQNSHTIDGRSAKAEGIFKASYFLDPNMYTIESLFLECEVKLDIPKKITIAISDMTDSGKVVIDSKINLYIPTDEIKDKINRELVWMKILLAAMLICIAFCIYIFKKR